MMQAADRELWQEAPCYYTGDICQAKCEPACMCQNGTLATTLMFRQFEAEAMKELK